MRPTNRSTANSATSISVCSGFRNRREAAVAIEEWRRHYNEVRPHSSLGYRTPLEFKSTDAATITEGRSPATPARADQEDRKTETITSTDAILP